ncbi:unnamed protein product [Rhodiola kirilowii]
MWILRNIRTLASPFEMLEVRIR